MDGLSLYQNGTPLGRGLKHAWKNITYGYKSFLCFFIAMFVCQTFCLTLILSNAASNAHVRDTVLLEYDYHFSVSGLSDGDAVLLRNAVSNANEAGMEYSLWFEEQGNTSTAYLVAGELCIANGDTERLYNAFTEVVLPNSGVSTLDDGVTVRPAEKSPLMTCETVYIRPNNLTSLFLILPLAVISMLLLMFLYQIRLNDRKFTLGICMTYGADFKRLFSEAVTELLLLSAISLVPAAVFSTAAVMCIYLPNGIPLVFPAWQIFLFLLFNFAIVYASVYLPTKRFSQRNPVSLIGREDNTGAVSSPRRSFRILGKSFPRDYELFGFIRFRTYFIKLILTATLFSALFVGGCYLCEIFTATAVGDITQFIISTPESVEEDEALSDTEDFISLIEGIDGVTCAEWTLSSAASADRASMLLCETNVKRASDYIIDTRTVQNTEQYTKANYERLVEGGYIAATNSFAYTLMNRQMIDLMCERYTVEGDPYAILEKTDHIILGESIFNRKVFDFAPGDQIVLCEYVSGKISDFAVTIGDEAVLQEILTNCGIRFHVFTVAAVVKNAPSENHILAGLCAEDYEYFTEDVAAPTEVSVKLRRGLSTEALSEIRTSLADVMEIYTDIGYEIEETEEFLAAKLQDDAFINVRTAFWSVLILLLAPLIWLFSQTLFFGKRENEFYILRALGAYETDIRNIHLWSGVFLAACAALITLLEGILCNYLLYAFCNYVLTRIGILRNIRYAFSVPPVALLAAVVMSMAFAFLSAYLPYLSYRKKMKAAATVLCGNVLGTEAPSSDEKGEEA